MIDPVQVIEDIATAAGYKFLYGGSAYINYELDQLGTIDDDEIIIIMDSFRLPADVINGTIDRFSLQTLISVARKSESAGTISQLNETEREKYDRRLKDLAGVLVNFIASISCNSDVMALDSFGFENYGLNRHDLNLDMVIGSVAFSFPHSPSGTGYDITAPLPEYIDWSRIINAPELFSGSYNDLTDKPTIPEEVDMSEYLKKISPDIAMITGSENAPTTGEGIKTQFLTGSKTALIQVINTLTGAYSNGGLQIDVRKLLLTLSGVEIARAESSLFTVKTLKILNSVFNLDNETPVDGDMLRYNGTTEKYEAVNRVGFSARKSTTSINANTWTNISFDIEVNDTHDAWDGTTFTVPSGEGGTYIARGHLTFTSVTSGNRAIVAVSVNGEDPGTDDNVGGLLGRGVSAGTQASGYGGAIEIELEEGYTVNVMAYCQNATLMLYPKGYCTFSIKKIYP